MFVLQRSNVSDLHVHAPQGYTCSWHVSGVSGFDRVSFESALTLGVASPMCLLCLYKPHRTQHAFDVYQVYQVYQLYQVLVV